VYSSAGERISTLVCVCGTISVVRTVKIGWIGPFVMNGNTVYCSSIFVDCTGSKNFIKFLSVKADGSYSYRSALKG
jgi:hypothetical protein